MGDKKGNILEWFRRGSTKASENKPEGMTIAKHMDSALFACNLFRQSQSNV